MTISKRISASGCHDGGPAELRKMFMTIAMRHCCETVYMNQYREPGISYVGTFAEDLDLTTGTLWE